MKLEVAFKKFSIVHIHIFITICSVTMLKILNSLNCPSENSVQI